jgi:hypothetical protein
LIAHQKKVRDHVAATKSGDLFGKWWEDIDPDISKAVVRKTDHNTARTIIQEYEWLGCLAAVNWHYFGIFFEGVCGGVVVYGQEYIENLGRWDKYGYTGKPPYGAKLNNDLATRGCPRTVLLLASHHGH